MQASAARLMYVMGRDGALPKAVFGNLSKKTGTPVFNLLLTAAAGVLAMKLDLTTATSFINFGAFLGFTLVNVCVIAHLVRERRQGRSLNFFSYLVMRPSALPSPSTCSRSSVMWRSRSAASGWRSASSTWPS
ncbi:amino acid permease [Streptomyces kaempferi]